MLKFGVCTGVSICGQLWFLTQHPIKNEVTQRPQRNQSLLYFFESCFLTFFCGWAILLPKTKPSLLWPLSGLVMGVIGIQKFDYHWQPMEKHLSWALMHASIGTVLARITYQSRMARAKDLFCMMAYFFGYGLFNVCLGDMSKQFEMGLKE